MDVLIARNRLLKEIREVYEYEYPTASGAFDDFVKRIIPNIIKNQTTVDVVPVVHGHWIKVKDVCGISILKCSICGIDHPREATAYCCDCGAKMKPNFIA